MDAALAEAVALTDIPVLSVWISGSCRARDHAAQTALFSQRRGSPLIRPSARKADQSPETAQAMIRPLHSPATARHILATHELPDLVQEPVLRDLVFPRVVSSSMRPTLEAGDRLELESAQTLQIGDVIVFRHNALFICHRIVLVEQDRLRTRGDAAGSVPEETQRALVIGRVAAIMRNGVRRTLPAWSGTASRLTTHQYAAESRERLRASTVSFMKRLVALPFLGTIARRLIIRAIAVDVMEEAPLHCVSGYIKQRTCKASEVPALLQGSSQRIMTPGTRLVFRAGPFVLGICRLSPRSLNVHQTAHTLGLEMFLSALCQQDHIHDGL
jgi:hypothetical protein